MGIKYSFVVFFHPFRRGRGGGQGPEIPLCRIVNKYTFLRYDKYIGMIKLIIFTNNLKNRKLINFAQNKSIPAS